MGRNVVEIGPGPGGLTRALLDTGGLPAWPRWRFDSRAVAAMQELAVTEWRRLSVIAGDALALDLAALVPAPRQVVANLPYNIASPSVGAVGCATPPAFERLTLMFQQEVAERICAAARQSSAYGRLSVLAQWTCAAEIAVRVPPAAFVPPELLSRL